MTTEEYDQIPIGRNIHHAGTITDIQIGGVREFPKQAGSHLATTYTTGKRMIETIVPAPRGIYPFVQFIDTPLRRIHTTREDAIAEIEERVARELVNPQPSLPTRPLDFIRQFDYCNSARERLYANALRESIRDRNESV